MGAPATPQGSTGLGFRVQGLGLRVEGTELRVYSKVQGLRSSNSDKRFRVLGSGFSLSLTRTRVDHAAKKQVVVRGSLFRSLVVDGAEVAAVAELAELAVTGCASAGLAALLAWPCRDTSQHCTSYSCSICINAAK